MRRASKCVYYLFDPQFSIIKEKAIVVLYAFFLIAVGIVITPLTISATGKYTVFTFIENIWLLLVLLSVICILKAKRYCESAVFSKLNAMNIERSSDGLAEMDLDTTIYFRIFRILALISNVCNAICVWMGDDPVSIVLATILEIIFFRLSKNFLDIIEDFYLWYDTATYFTGSNESKTAIVTIVSYKNALYTKEDFLRKFHL